MIGGSGGPLRLVSRKITLQTQDRRDNSRSGSSRQDGRTQTTLSVIEKEKILVYADMFNLPPPNDSVPHPPVVGRWFSSTRGTAEAGRGTPHVDTQSQRLTTAAEMKASLNRKEDYEEDSGGTEASTNGF